MGLLGPWHGKKKKPTAKHALGGPHVIPFDPLPAGPHTVPRKPLAWWAPAPRSKFEQAWQCLVKSTTNFDS